MAETIAPIRTRRAQREAAERRPPREPLSESAHARRNPGAGVVGEALLWAAAVAGALCILSLIHI